MTDHERLRLLHHDLINREVFPKHFPPHVGAEVLHARELRHRHHQDEYLTLWVQELNHRMFLVRRDSARGYLTHYGSRRILRRSRMLG